MGWEIYRNGRPLSVRLRGGNHASKNVTERAGAKALREFRDSHSDGDYLTSIRA
jgi:hypothetical protein